MSSTEDRGRPEGMSKRQKRRFSSERKQEDRSHPGERKRERRSGEEERKGPQSYTPSCCQESDGSTVIDEDEVDKTLGAFRSWMKDHLPDGLGVSQLGAHLVLQLRRSPTAISRFLTRMLAEPSSVGGEGERQRSILPLPVLPDSREAVRKIVADEEYQKLAGGTKAKRDMGGSKVHREALGNSFHCVVMSSLLDLWLWSREIRTEPRGAAWIIERWRKEMESRMSDGIQDSDGEDGDQQPDESESERLALVSEQRLRQGHVMRPSDAEVDSAMAKRLSQALVHHYLRRMEFRGSDVRLDVGLFYRPDAAPRTSIDPGRWSWSVAHSYPFRTQEHINILELRAILHTLEWRARTSTFHSCRFLHLSDSQVCLTVLVKGRSSSRKVNRLLRRICSLCLALNVYPLWSWIESRLNPADEPSRRYEDAKGGAKL